MPKHEDNKQADTSYLSCQMVLLLLELVAAVAAAATVVVVVVVIVAAHETQQSSRVGQTEVPIVYLGRARRNKWTFRCCDYVFFCRRTFRSHY